MIIHYELGNEQLLNSLINSTKRLLIQQDRLNKAEELMIEFFTKIIKLNKNDAIKQHFIEFHKKALQLSDDEDANISLRYFNVLKWMESKINHVPLINP
jgi:DNA-directed RNA polymerase alpha subunit